MKFRYAEQLDLPYPTSGVSIKFTVSGMSAAEEASPEETSAAAEETAAPAETEAADATAAATEDKGNAETGIEGCAAVAGIAIVTATAGIIAKKRRK